VHVIVRYFLASFEVNDWRTVEAIEMAGAKLDVSGAIVVWPECFVADRATVGVECGVMLCSGHHHMWLGR
jgi:hypothetical protein